MSTLDRIVTQYTEGDWVFCDFELRQVMTVEEDGRITKMKDGACSYGSHDWRDRCVPMTQHTKRISDTFNNVYTRIHKQGVSGLNYPDIHRWLVEQWVKACNAADGDQLTQIYAELRTFETTIINAGQENSIYGFPLFRRK